MVGVRVANGAGSVGAPAGRRRIGPEDDRKEKGGRCKQRPPAGVLGPAEGGLGTEEARNHGPLKRDRGHGSQDRLYPEGNR